jgi:hypothetical protein
MADTLHSGAQALVALQVGVLAVVEADCVHTDIDAGIEHHSFEAIDALVLDSIMANIVHADPLRRRGYVRSLAVLFHDMALGCVPDVDRTMVATVLRTLQATEGRAHG